MNAENDIKKIRRLIAEGVITEEEVARARVLEIETPQDVEITLTPIALMTKHPLTVSGVELSVETLMTQTNYSQITSAPVLLVESGKPSGDQFNIIGVCEALTVEKITEQSLQHWKLSPGKKQNLLGQEGLIGQFKFYGQDPYGIFSAAIWVGDNGVIPRYSIVEVSFQEGEAGDCFPGSQ